MGSRLITALFLAHQVANALEIPGNFGNIVKVAAAATTANPSATACAIAYDVIDSCYSASPGLSTAAETAQASCLCCYSTVAIDSYYSVCADYIATSYPASSTQYSAFSGLASACSSDMPVCRGGAGGGSASASASSTVTTTATGVSTETETDTRTAASATATATGTGGSDTVPAACTDFQAIITSCVAATPSITAVADSIAAECLCYTTSAGTSSYTTKLDRLADSCAPWAKTAAKPTFYSAVAAFEDFCESYSPTSTSTTTRRGATTSAETDTATTTTRTGGGLGGGSGATTTTTTPRSTTTATTTPAAANVAPAAAGGLVLWTANLFSFVLSFFLLI